MEPNIKSQQGDKNKFRWYSLRLMGARIYLFCKKIIRWLFGNRDKQPINDNSDDSLDQPSNTNLFDNRIMKLTYEASFGSDFQIDMHTWEAVADVPEGMNSSGGDTLVMRVENVDGDIAKRTMMESMEILTEQMGALTDTIQNL